METKEGRCEKAKGAVRASWALTFPDKASADVVN